MQESVSTFNLDSVEDDQQHRRIVKPHKSILGNRIHLSHAENNNYIYQKHPLLFNSVEAGSVNSEEPNTDFKETDVNKLKDLAKANIDSGTQTSKTILQLAQTDMGYLTPDSLMQSPRNSEWLSQNNHLDLRQLESKLQAIDVSCCMLDRSACEEGNAATYTRKNNLKQYLDSYKTSTPSPSEEEVAVYPKTSLTQTFLTKKKNENKSLPCNCRSTFLQQTSPLRNLSVDSANSNGDYFKSQSYVDEYLDNPVVPRQMAPYQVSRFTVKSVKEQQWDKTQPLLTCHWNPIEAKNIVITHGSKNKVKSSGNCDQCSFNSCNVSTLHHSPRQSSSRGKYHNHPSTFMSPTFASEQRSQSQRVQELKTLISPTRRGRSMSPSANRLPPTPIFKENEIQKGVIKKIPYIDQSQSQLTVIRSEPHKAPARKSISHRQQSPSRLSALDTKLKFDEDLLKLDLQSLDVKLYEETSEMIEPSCTSSVTSTENAVTVALNRIRNPDWNVALKGIAEMTELCRTIDPDLIFPHMTTVNQRLLELLRSPRSHVCRTACQAAGHFFESMKDTRRPVGEFDDIVENLLYKTADANKFIRKDANLSLDCMVTHIPIYHSVRSLCLKGPSHKNSLVRTATIRLIVCGVVIAGPEVVLNLPSHEHTRKRIILHLPKFLADKNLETRKYGERLYKIFCKQPMFDLFLKKYLEKHDVNEMKMSLKVKPQKK